MDAATATDAERRLAAELTRAGGPDGFPALPDVPLGRYTDADFARLEVEEVFGRSWLLVGHGSEIPDAGSYRVIDLPGGSVVVVRGSDGVVRAVRNACRHRGAPVVRDGAGCARRLTCQFHSWSYDLTGGLVAVPCESDFVGLDRSERSLAAVRLEEWNGLLFVNLDPAAPDLAAELAPISRRFDAFMGHRLRLVERRRYDLGCNWKVVMEAFLEVYHLRTVHPETASQFAHSSSPLLVAHPGGHGTMYMAYTDEVLEAEEGSLVRDVMFPSDLPSPEGMPSIFDTTNVLLSLFPNVVSPLNPQGFPVVQAWPKGIDRTDFEVSWYGPDWGDGDRPAGWDTKFGAWDIVLEEDFSNLEPIQRSLEAAAHGGVPLGAQERLIWHLHAELDRRIGPDSVPAGLAVAAQLLDELIEA
ncbi:MAG TPA: aromatic ring-hydroxylating dioxygenase subunit alpha [Acidimicrobiales bacterium]